MTNRYPFSAEQTRDNAPAGHRWVTICHTAHGKQKCWPVLVKDDGRVGAGRYHGLRPRHGDRPLENAIRHAAQEHERRRQEDAEYEREALAEAHEHNRQSRAQMRSFLSRRLRDFRRTINDTKSGYRGGEYKELPHWVKSKRGQAPDIVARDFAEAFPGAGVETSDDLYELIDHLDRTREQDRKIPGQGRRYGRRYGAVMSAPAPAYEHDEAGYVLI